MNKNSTTIAYMCPYCNDFSLHNISIFSFSGNRKKTFECSCKNSTLNIVKNTTKSFKIDILCPVCDEDHSYVVPYNQFWSNDVFAFSCPFYEANILFIGKTEKVDQSVRDYIAEELTFGEKPPFIPDYYMLEKVIDFIKYIDENPDAVKICSCASTYSTAYNEEEIYIICDKCHYSLPISYKEIDNYLKNVNN